MSMGNLGTANKVAKRIKEIIDYFWMGELGENEARQQIEEIMSNPENRIKVKRSTSYTSVFTNIMGKKRLADFERLTASKSDSKETNGGTYIV